MLDKLRNSGVASFLKNLTSEKNLNILREFFMGKWYPVWVAFSVLIGRVTCLELYFTMLDFVLVATALLLCDSIRPVLPNLITFLFRIPLEHSPGYPYYSTYYGGVKIVFFAIFASVFFAALVYFFVKNKVFAKVNIVKTPLFIPLAVFSLSFLTAGMLSGNRMKEDIGFALLQVFVFFIVYLILYYGLRSENERELSNYFIYISAMCAVVLILEVLDVFLRVDGAMVGGVMNKQYIDFGWGISNTCGSALSVLTPMCVLGAMRAERRYVSAIYFTIGVLTATAVYFTLARASVLVGTVGFLICMIISCFAGKQKKVCRIATVLAIAIFVAISTVFKEDIRQMFTHFTNEGLDDNGRYYLWNVAWERFKAAPLFGNGYFSYNVGPKMSTFIPSQAHNTFLQLMCSMGLFGLVSYIVYRVYTFFPFFKRFTIDKFVLMVSCGILVFESLIDNFIFWFSPTFIYNIIIVLAFMHCEQYVPSEDKPEQKEISDGAQNSPEEASVGASDETGNVEGEMIVHDSPVDIENPNVAI